MADDGKKGGMDLEAILKMARNKPMNVAMVIGKDGLALAGDPRKGLEVMWREAKGLAGGGSKGGMGVCNVVGKEIQIQFTEEYPATLKKAFKDKLRDMGMKFKPVFIGADGMSDGDGDEEEGEDGEGTAVAGAEQAGGGEPGEDPEAQLRTELLEEFKGFKDQLSDAKVASPPPALKKLGALEAMFQTEIERAPKKAMAVLSLLKKTAGAFAPAVGSPTADPMADERRMGLASLEKSVDALLAEFG